MEVDNFMYARKPRQNKWIYIFFLILSFVWLSIYPTVTSMVSNLHFGFGNLLSDSNMYVAIVGIVTEALISWIVFEILFWIYRFVLSFKIYSFIVPMDSLKAETRLYFIFRNVILGVVYNLCFLCPYLYMFNEFFDLLITLLVLIFYAKHLNQVYSESIVGHFVFKNFCYPIFIYEALEILCGIWLVLLWENWKVYF